MHATNDQTGQIDQRGEQQLTLVLRDGHLVEHSVDLGRREEVLHDRAEHDAKGAGIQELLEGGSQDHAYRPP
jgi:hypothetical protein